MKRFKICLIHFLFTPIKNFNLKQSFKMTSDNAELFRIEGNRHFHLKQFDEAVNWYSKALNEQRTALLYSNRAQAYLELDRNADAYLDAKEALQLAPNDFKALFRCGLALVRLGRLEFAKEMLEKCAALETENKNVEMKLNEIKQMLEQRNANKCANADAGPSNLSSIISTDIWRQVFTFIGPAERTNVGQLNKIIWSTFWDHHFERGKKRLSRRLVYLHHLKNKEEQFLVKETFGNRFHIVPIADSPVPPNIVGLDLCIEAQPGKKLLKFLTNNKHFLSHSMLKFECLYNFISTVPDQMRHQFMELFGDNHFTAIWGQENNTYPKGVTNEEQQLAAADANHSKFATECATYFKRLAVYGPINNEFNAIRMTFLLFHLQPHRHRQMDPVRVLTLDDDWQRFTDEEWDEYCKRVVHGMPPNTFAGMDMDAQSAMIQVLYDWFLVDVEPIKYAASMQKMHRHGLRFNHEKGRPYIIHKVNKLGEVFDLRLHERNGMTCMLLRRCPAKDLEKEYMHPDVLFSNPKGDEFVSRIMVAGINDPPHPTNCDLRICLPEDLEPSEHHKTEMQAYYDSTENDPTAAKLNFHEMPRYYYFDFIQREWIRRKRHFNSVDVFGV